jgi:hypothetical protein
VTFNPPEALVTYDPRRASVDDLIAAVKNAKDVNEFSAHVKTSK